MKWLYPRHSPATQRRLFRQLCLTILLAIILCVVIGVALYELNVLGRL